MLQVNPPLGKRIVRDWKSITLIVEPGKFSTWCMMIEIACTVCMHMFVMYVNYLSLSLQLLKVQQTSGNVDHLAHYIRLKG